MTRRSTVRSYVRSLIRIQLIISFEPVEQLKSIAKLIAVCSGVAEREGEGEREHRFCTDTSTFTTRRYKNT